MRDHRIDLDQSFHVPVHDARRIYSPARAAERRATPHTSRNELERPCRDLSSRRRNADDDTLAPAAMTGLQSLAHDRYVPCAIEGVVGAAAGELDEVRHDIAGHFLR